jgi:hypothetical protein
MVLDISGIELSHSTRVPVNDCGMTPDNQKRRPLLGNGLVNTLS